MKKEEAINDFYKKLASQVNFKKAGNSYELDEESRRNFGLDNPDITNDFNNLSPEEINSLEMRFNSTLNSCLKQISDNSMTPEAAMEFDEELRSLFVQYVSGQTPAEEWMIETDKNGSQGVAELPAGQKLIQLFFDGDDSNWYNLCAALLDIYRPN